MKCLCYPVAEKQFSQEAFPASLRPIALAALPLNQRADCSMELKTRSWHFKDGSKGGEIERPSAITLGAFALAELGVPPSAKDYAWCYQSIGLHEERNSKDSDKEFANCQSRQFFLKNGGFVYLDDAGTITQILAVSDHLEGETKLCFGQPYEIDMATVAAFRKECRFHEVTVPYLEAAGAQEYMWLTPGELPSAQHGAFVYILTPQAVEIDSGGVCFCCGSAPVAAEQQPIFDDVTHAETVMAKPPFDLAVAVETAARQLPKGPRVCILGGRKFQERSSELLVKELAKEFAAKLKDRAVVLTGGLEGIQETFATSLGLPSQVVNMVPEGESAQFSVGKEVRAGANLGERIQIYGQIGDIYLTIEGGPGVSKEARAASDRDAVVLPMAWTGGASGGMFDFPAKALSKPDYFSEEEWRQVKEKTEMDEVELAQSTAKTVIRGIVTLVERHQ